MQNLDAVKQAWVEPAVDALEVEETNTNPGVGADGSLFPDCTKS